MKPASDPSSADRRLPRSGRARVAGARAGHERGGAAWWRVVALIAAGAVGLRLFAARDGEIGARGSEPGQQTAGSGAAEPAEPRGPSDLESPSASSARDALDPGRSRQGSEAVAAPEGAPQEWAQVSDRALAAMLAPLRQAVGLPDPELAGYALSGGQHRDLERAVLDLLARHPEREVPRALALERAQVHCGALAARQREFLWAQLAAAESKLASGAFERRRVGGAVETPEPSAPPAPGKQLGLMFYGGSEWFAECTLLSTDVPGCEQHQSAVRSASEALQVAILQ